MEFKKSIITSLLLSVGEELSRFDKEISRILSELMTNLTNMFDRGITFSENISCDLVAYTSNAVANTEDTVAHALGKIPTGYLVYGIDKACSIYLGSTTWTATNIYLKTSVATVAVKIIVF